MRKAYGKVQGGIQKDLKNRSHQIILAFDLIIALKYSRAF